MKSITYPKKIVFTDKNDNTVEIESTNETISLWSGPMEEIKLTKNQAGDLAKILNFWFENKRLSAGEIKFNIDSPKPIL